ncbi:unnamed protein product [Allacma fusca]|uniref:DNA/RNA non-specific endonuclease/pyrophosphatase/phosphodiesterase domain-containing protein n=1 Tax=Allacma fusca TaxID=39272 RepID=A0A8J2PYV2_9HEXA|nr:unnamed protein product [Allacma fusca]
MITFLALSLTIIVTGGNSLALSENACILPRAGMPTNMSMLIGENGKVYPQNEDNGDIILPLGSIITVSCAPATNLLQNYNVNEIEVECRGEAGLMVIPSLVPTSFDQLGCSNRIKEDVVEIETCYKGSSNVSIQFDSATERLPLITVCHNRTAGNTLYSHHTLYGGSGKVPETSNKRPSFKKDNFYGKVSPDTSYSQSNQIDIVTSLVGSAPLANQYIDPSQSFYFARGHLSPDGDFIYVAEQNATYYFINVIPQWQSINNGNWKAMEMAVRDLASQRGSSLEIYTGGYSTLALKDKDDKPVEIYLARDPITNELMIPVPKLTWKIVHDPKQKTATVIVMVNNPHELSITSKDIICKDVCDQIKWVTWDRGNVRKGYTYCCTLSTFNKQVPYAPKISGVKLLV